jgi:Xaa-Pro aminopeptidase
MHREEFAWRRKHLMETMGTGLAILTTTPPSVRNGDTHFPYRPDSDFYYLTGFPEPEAMMVLVPGRPEGEFVLFCRERDPQQEVWHGRRAGLEGARTEYGADEAFPITEADERLPGLLENRERVFYSMGRYPDFDQRLMQWVNKVRAKARTGVRAPREYVALDHLVHEMRLIKSPAEVEVMRRAAQISASAHRRAMQACRPGLREYQVEAELTYEFVRYGSRFPAYPPIVGGGANACILHYTENDAELRAGDLLLIDAGGEYEYYASDITRTFPVSGVFSPEQRTVYELVLAAQRAAIAQIRPGNRWNQPHEAAVRVLTQGILDLGLLQGELEKLIADEAYRRFYMHRTGHWLGMDVHDVGDYKVNGEWRLLKPGMVMTVEPGLYVPAGSEGIDPRFWNIGVRIEDDVLVTAEGHEVLTRDVPKAVDEIEALMAASKGQSRAEDLALAAHG